MVRINLLRKRGSVEPTELTEEYVEIAASEDEEQAGFGLPARKPRKGGSFKIFLIIFIIMLLGGGGYYAYFIVGLENLPYIGTKQVDRMVVADEVSMDDPPIETQQETATETPDRAAQDAAPVAATSSTPVSTTAKERTVAEQPEGEAAQIATGIVADQARGGRYKLIAFNGILKSVESNVQRLYLTITDEKVNIELGVNSRADAAIFLRNVRNNWTWSNLKAEAFERAGKRTNYTYHSQFSGEINAAHSRSAVTRSSFYIVPFGKFRQDYTANIIRAGLKLRELDSKPPTVRDGMRYTPVQITADGELKDVVKLLTELATWDAGYAVSRASLLFRKGSNVVLTLHLELLGPVMQSS